MNQGEPVKAFPFLELVFSATTREELGMFLSVPSFRQSNKSSGTSFTGPKLVAGPEVSQTPGWPGPVCLPLITKSHHLTLNVCKDDRQINSHGKRQHLGVCDRNQSRLF